MNDRADDVINSFIYYGKEGNFIITKEQIFQATSKESGGGFTRISGYSEYRLSSYDLATGELTGRINMEEGQEKEFVLMGTTAGKIWLYSVDEELGLHCRNPKTLEVISTEKQLSASAPLNGFSFARPEWSKLDSHYGWSADNGLLMLSDMQGFHYYFDPEKNTLNKTDDEIPDYDWSVTRLNSSGYFSKEDYISLNGSGRQFLQFRYEDSTGKLSYLDGKLILDCNPVSEAKRTKAYVDSLSRTLALYTDSLKQIATQYPDLDEQRRTNARDYEKLYRIKSNQSDFKRKVDDLERELKNSERKFFEVYDNPLLMGPEGQFFVWHGTNVTDTSHVLLTSVSLKGRTFTENWSSPLSGLYIDPAKAESKGAFETVFSEGNPEFDYLWYEVYQDKLIFIAQLQMYCIDIKSGKTIWQHPL